MPDYTLPAGKLRHRIEVQRPTRTQDPDSGMVVDAWDTFAEIHAAVEPLSVREFVAAGAAQATVDTRMTVRHRGDIDATCRIRYRGQLYDVQGVLPDPVSGREYMTIACRAGAHDG